MNRLRGIVIWTGGPEVDIQALVWAEDGGELIYLYRGITSFPGDWTPDLGDLVWAKFATVGRERRALKAGLDPAPQNPAAGHDLRERLKAAR